MWYYAIKRDTLGPVDEAAMKDLIQNGTINGQSRVWGPGMVQWQPLDQSPLAPLLSGRPATEIPQSAGTPSERVRAAVPPAIQINSAAAAKLLFMRPVLAHLSSGRLFNRLAALGIRIAAGLYALGSLMAWVQTWRILGDLSGFGVLGGILFQLLFPIGVYMVVHIMLIRAREIAHLVPSEFTMLPILGIFLRMLGEVYAAILVSVGVGGSLFMLLAGENYLARAVISEAPLTGFVQAFGMVFARSADSSFVASVIFLISSVLTAFFMLGIFYWLAEAATVFVSIAKNIRLIRETVTTPRDQS